MIKDLIRRYNYNHTYVKGPLKLWEVKEMLLNMLQVNDGYFNNYLIKKYGSPKKQPTISVENGIMKYSDYEAAAKQVDELGLPHALSLKDWDTMIALKKIMDNTDKNARVLDAGSELTSKILIWLYMYGYRNLWGNNLSFYRTIRKGSIVYEYGDITKTKYTNGFFDAVTCLSVIEHNVDIKKFYTEMARIVKKGGLLIVSTDYFQKKLRANNSIQYWNAETNKYEEFPWEIFDEQQLKDMIAFASSVGLEITGNFSFESPDRPVKYNGEEYTFAILTFKRA